MSEQAETPQTPQPSKADAALQMLLSRLPDAQSYSISMMIGGRIEMVYKGALGDIMVLHKIVETDMFKKHYEPVK